jgi:hypothetical protein
MDSGSSGTVQPARRTLVPGKLNVVGETHNESDARRVAEMQFSLAKTGSVNYWTEAEFLDAYQRFGDRHARGGQDKAQGDPAAADLQYRAAHCAALVIVSFEELANEADRVAVALPTSATPNAVLSTFADVKIRAFIQARDLLAAGWQKTQSEGVNAAAEAVYTNVRPRLRHTSPRYATRRPTSRSQPQRRWLATVSPFAPWWHRWRKRSARHP